MKFFVILLVITLLTPPMSFAESDACHELFLNQPKMVDWSTNRLGSLWRSFNRIGIAEKQSQWNALLRSAMKAFGIRPEDEYDFLRVLDEDIELPLAYGEEFNIFSVPVRENEYELLIGSWAEKPVKPGFIQKFKNQFSKNPFKNFKFSDDDRKQSLEALITRLNKFESVARFAPEIREAFRVRLVREMSKELPDISTLNLNSGSALEKNLPSFDFNKWLLRPKYDGAFGPLSFHAREAISLTPTKDFSESFARLNEVDKANKTALSDLYHAAVAAIDAGEYKWMPGFGRTYETDEPIDLNFDHTDTAQQESRPKLVFKSQAEKTAAIVAAYARYKITFQAVREALLPFSSPEFISGLNPNPATSRRLIRYTKFDNTFGVIVTNDEDFANVKRFRDQLSALLLTP